MPPCRPANSRVRANGVGPRTSRRRSAAHRHLRATLLLAEHDYAAAARAFEALCDEGVTDSGVLFNFGYAEPVRRRCPHYGAGARATARARGRTGCLTPNGCCARCTATRSSMRRCGRMVDGPFDATHTRRPPASSSLVFFDAGEADEASFRLADEALALRSRAPSSRWSSRARSPSQMTTWREPSNCSGEPLCVHPVTAACSRRWASHAWPARATWSRPKKPSGNPWPHCRNMSVLGSRLRGAGSSRAACPTLARVSRPRSRWIATSVRRTARWRSSTRWKVGARPRSKAPNAHAVSGHVVLHGAMPRPSSTGAPRTSRSCAKSLGRRWAFGRRAVLWRLEPWHLADALASAIDFADLRELERVARLHRGRCNDRHFAVAAARSGSTRRGTSMTSSGAQPPIRSARPGRSPNRRCPSAAA